jgi:hypothetical protein
MKSNKQEELKTTIHFILAGIFLNGIVQGKTNSVYDDTALSLADEEIKKLFENYEKKY